ncbi:branched-chain amino acid aminotransferase [Mangrovibacterium diazotrophicum]|uniref:branched-chain-amino-acid transaminase n=2 Tax=Mangrovibacterium diazotrophicum TaxID=1261403 RepID=A0A419VYM8_9BACT|nr:branched-chain amino acid aminotransferase [Mangrovibacterium diazotrophicum]
MKAFNEFMRDKSFGMNKITTSNRKIEPTSYIKNGVAEELPFEPFKGDNALQVYEVLRVIDGVALFLEDHYARFQNSWRKFGLNDPVSASEFEAQISELIRLNKTDCDNIKVELWIEADGKQTLRMFVIPSNYPTADQYRLGVPTGFLHAMRTNPQIKVAHLPVRELADRTIIENNWYEVLLVDRDGFITEGSRSNVFLVKESVFYTAPAEKVLIGITRLKIMECIRKLGIECRETDISATDLNQYEAAFISGTSPKILPISSLGAIQFDVKHPVLRQLMKEFDDFIQSYIDRRKSGSEAL